jgi:hypothetical protein
LNINYWLVFNVINITFTANTMVPLPGGTGSWQIIIKSFLLTLCDFQHNNPNVSNDTINDFLNNVIALSTFFGMAFCSIGIFWIIKVFVSSFKETANKIKIDKKIK